MWRPAAPASGYLLLLASAETLYTAARGRVLACDPWTLIVTNPALVYADITIDQLLMSATKPYFTCALFHLFIFNIKFEIEFTLRLPFRLV